MEDKRGEFYSGGYCTASNSDCKNSQAGACGICSIGGTYRNIVSELTSQDSDSAIEKMLMTRNL